MLVLRIEPHYAVRPTPPRADSPNAELWRDNDGTICASGEVIGGDCWMHLPGVASFRFGGASRDVVAVAHERATRDAIVDAYHRTVLPMALQMHGLEVLHASAVRAPNGVVALCAVKETGKSTLAYALAERGLPLWADDAVVVDAGREPVAALSVPFDIRLRPASAEFFRRGLTVPTTRGNRDGSEPIELAPAPLAAICVLARNADLPRGPAVQTRRLTAGEAFSGVLAHAYCFSLSHTDRKREMMSHLLALVARVPVYEVRFAAGLHHLPVILDAILEASGTAPVPSELVTDPVVVPALAGA